MKRKILVTSGLLANLSTIAEIERWSKLHFSQLQQIVSFAKRNWERLGLC
jgi:hypothetical protein